MIPINSLEGKVTKLERQRKAHIRFEMVEEHWPGDDHFGECNLAFKRNGETIARFPRKLTVTEWEAKFNPNHN